jgi:hypothetical protein
MRRFWANALFVLAACSNNATPLGTDGGPGRDASATDGTISRDASAADAQPELDAETGEDAALQDGATAADAMNLDAAPFMDASIVDSGSRDAAAPFDGGPNTPCGTDGRVCDRSTEVCVEFIGGIGPSYNCQPVPAACQNDRTCACLAPTYCMGMILRCSDPGQDNEILCTCIACN